MLAELDRLTESDRRDLIGYCQLKLDYFGADIAATPDDPALFHEVDFLNQSELMAVISHVHPNAFSGSAA